MSRLPPVIVPMPRAVGLDFREAGSAADPMRELVVTNPHLARKRRGKAS